MKKYKVTTAIVLDTRRVKKDDVYPVKIRLTYKGQRQYYNIGYDMTEADFALTMEGKSKFKDKFLKFTAIETEAKDVINSITDFSFDQFKKKFFDDISTDDFFGTIKLRIKQMELDDRQSTADSLRSTLRSVEEFYPYNKLPFGRITVKMLKEYEQHLRKKGKKDGTICLYQRNIRRVFNYAIHNGDVLEDIYPFGNEDDGKYEIPEGDVFKRALPKTEVLKIHNYKALPGSPEEYYRDFWMFSYLANGMNLADIARLTYGSIIDDKIVFYRKKIDRKVKRKKPIIIEVIPEVQDIIDRWGNQQTRPDTYIFNILRKGLTPAEELATVKQATKQLNKYIGRIAASVGIKGKVTSYSARHSFAQVMKLSGESVSFISEALGHQNLSTTEIYLSSFDSKHRRRAQKKLL